MMKRHCKPEGMTIIISVHPWHRATGDQAILTDPAPKVDTTCVERRESGGR